MIKVWVIRICSGGHGMLKLFRDVAKLNTWQITYNIICITFINDYNICQEPDFKTVDVLT